MATSKKNKETEAEQRPQKSQRIILQHTEEAALSQIERSSGGLVLSGLSAGLDIGFSVLLMCVSISLFSDVFPAPVVDFIAANMYPIGFIFVVLGRSELFTEHTTLAVLPVLQKLASIKKLLRLWILVYFSNIAGGLVFALILSFFTRSLHFIEISSLTQIAGNFLQYNWLTLLVSAVLAGWLMGLLAWLVAAARETISQIFIIWIITAAIGFCGLPHCIVGNIEMAASMLSGNVSFSQYLSFLGPVTLGNAIGGCLFVGILKFSHTMKSGDEKVIDLENK